MAVLGDMMEMESSRDKDEEGRERGERRGCYCLVLAAAIFLSPRIWFNFCRGV